MKKKYGSTGTKVEKFLCDNIGENISIMELMTLGKFKQSEIQAVRQKLASLNKAGKITRVGKGIYKITSGILNGHAKQIASEIQVPAITPQAQDILMQLQQIQNAQPIDLFSILQAQTQATQHVILVEQQNRLLNQALDQIIHILEQCGKIEVKG